LKELLVEEPDMKTLPESFQVVLERRAWHRTCCGQVGLLKQLLLLII
jgi:hypothetical protein